MIQMTANAIRVFARVVAVSLILTSTLSGQILAQ